MYEFPKGFVLIFTTQKGLWMYKVFSVKLEFETFSKVFHVTISNVDDEVFQNMRNFSQFV